MTTTPMLACDLCGLDCGRDPVRQDSRRFCCLGCLNVYAILLESGALESGIDPRETDLFRRSAELGLISTKTAARKPALPENAPQEEKLFHLSGLWCASCAWLIEHTLLKEPGVLSAEVFFASDLLKVRYSPQYLPPGRIAERCASLGYRASEYAPDAGAAAAERKDLLLRFGVAAFLWLNVMGLNLAVYLGAFERMPGTLRRVLPFLVMLLAAPVLLYSARPILRVAFRGLLHGVLRMETLLSLGILSAYGYSAAQAFLGGTHIYFDIACAITALVLLGKSIEQAARQEAGATLAGLHQMLPRKARLLSEGRERFVSIDALRSGDLFLVKAGERIPADGVVAEGRSEADESLLTGESAPVAKEPGSAAVAGSLNLSQVLTIRATTVGQDSTLAQIVAAVERALSSRSDLERKVDRVARVFVPAVILIAAATFFGWSAAGLEPAQAFMRAVTVLVIACPCALGIATPLALTAAVSAASRKGILVRDSRALETVCRIDTVLFDKTGTVTEAEFALLEADPEHLPALAALEAWSEHPLGAAVVRRARESGIPIPQAAGVEILKGQGIRGIVEGRPIVIGSRALVSPTPAIDKEAAQWESRGSTTAFYSIDGRTRSLLAFGNRIRAEAPQVIAELHRRGIATALVSGDSAATTEAVARHLGVRDARAAVLPAAKIEAVRELQSQGRIVAMVGDGINDAPALAQADLGIALGAGADLARHAASLVLLGSQLTRVLDSIDLARRTVSIVRQNLFWAFFYNTLGIGFAAAGLLNPIVAAAAMVISSLSVVANSRRLASAP